jgi:cyanophycinase
MVGLVALVGGGEFLPAMAEFDLGLLASTGRRRPRVAIIPTAAFAAGEDAFQRSAAMGIEHFSALGAEVEPVFVRSRAAADDPSDAQAVGEADFVYLSAGRHEHLAKVLDGSALGRAVAAAHARGAVVVGCAAGATVLAERRPEFRRRILPWPLRWKAGLAFVKGAAVIPRYDAWPEPLSALMALQAPRGSVVVGLDDGTAIVGRDGSWQVHGRARVTIWRGRRRERFRDGDAFRLQP